MSYLWLLALSCALLWGPKLLSAMEDAHLRTLKSQKLPENVKPIRYNLTIVTLQNDSFYGEVEIELIVQVEQRYLTLNAKGLHVKKFWLRRKNTGLRITINSTETKPEAEQIIVHFNNRLWLGEQYKLLLQFKGTLETESIGYYKTSYVDNENKTVWLTTTHFKPNTAHYAFPCLDDPQFKTPFILNLAHHKSLQAVSNMPPKKRVKNTFLQDFVWTYFEESVPMPTYLLAYSLNSLVEQKFVRKKSPELTAWLRPGTEDHSSYAMNISSELLDYNEWLFNHSHPLAKIDQLVLSGIETNLGESFGLISFQETNFLYKENIDSLNVKQRVAERIAQRFSEQWVGHLASISKWDDNWIMKGLAMYIAGFGLDKVEPTWRHHEKLLLANIFNVFEEDDHVHTYSLSIDANLEHRVWQAFDSFSRTKSFMLFRMLHHLIGTDVFLKSMRAFVERYAEDLLDPDELWEIFQQISEKALSLRDDIKVQTVMNSWTQDQGYPLITVIRNHENKTATVTQTRFFRTPPNPNDIPSYTREKSRDRCWWLPLSYTVQSKPDFAHSMPRAWLKCPTTGKMVAPPLEIANLGSPDNWVIFNVRLSAPYRVNYDPINWALITETLLSDEFESIDKINRAQIIDDALNLAWTGIESYNLALTLMSYIHREDRFVVWEAALRSLNRINNALKQAPAYRLFKSYVRLLIEPQFRKIFGKDTNGSNASKAMMRLVMQIACNFDLPQCLERASKKFADFIANKTKIPEDQRDVVFCTAIRMGSESEWTTLHRLFAASKVSNERSVMLAGLGCSRDTWALEKVLRWAFEAKSKHITVQTFQSVVRNSVGYFLAKSYLFANMKNIKKFLGNVTGQIVQIVRPLILEVSTQTELEAFRTLMFEQLYDLPVIDTAISRLIERGRDNIHWRNNRLQDLTLAIRTHSKAKGD
ncbi:aminopeptidase N-like [Scaptodrosophila lebanonensis]|uniref:Aminopeptidase n=1 Tax=Drosophila lebanonensis TaxID=7225 RepID=A0A6J2U1W5_DROLE|nr:aminopeptidase N-like [Scaptodrosophila lebanonensis]